MSNWNEDNFLEKLTPRLRQELTAGQIACPDTTTLCSIADGDLRDREHRALTDHLAECPDCQAGFVNLCKNRRVLGVSCGDYRRHGCFAEQVVRTVDRERDRFDVAILDVSRVDEIDDAARALLAGMAEALRTQGKDGYLVDPDDIVIRTEPELEAFRYRTVDDAIAAARASVRGGLSG